MGGILLMVTTRDKLKNSKLKVKSLKLDLILKAEIACLTPYLGSYSLVLSLDIFL